MEERDFPEPVLPPISTCWRVPLPMARYWSFAAPAWPIGTRSSSAVSSDHISEADGVMPRKRNLDAIGILPADAHLVKEIA